MIKILLIGCGYWGKNWYNTIKTSPYELVGVVDPSPSIQVDVPLFDKIEDVNIDYTHAIICTNAELHLTIREKLNCKNVLVEKPCGTDMNRHKLKDCFPGYIFVSSPQFNIVKNTLDSGTLGKILFSRFERASMGPRIRTDVSIIDDYLIHDLYIYQSLFRNTNPKITGKLMNTFDDHIKADTVFLTVEDDNHISTFFSSWRFPSKIRRIQIIGELGSICWENDQVTLSNSRYERISGNDSYNNRGYNLVEEPPKTILPVDEKSNLHLQLDDFVNGKDRSELFENTQTFIRNIKQAIDK